MDPAPPPLTQQVSEPGGGSATLPQCGWLFSELPKEPACLGSWAIHLCTEHLTQDLGVTESWTCVPTALDWLSQRQVPVLPTQRGSIARTVVPLLHAALLCLKSPGAGSHTRKATAFSAPRGSVPATGQVQLVFLISTSAAAGRSCWNQSQGATTARPFPQLTVFLLRKHQWGPQRFWLQADSQLWGSCTSLVQTIPTPNSCLFAFRKIPKEISSITFVVGGKIS